MRDECRRNIQSERHIGRMKKKERERKGRRDRDTQSKKEKKTIYHDLKIK